MASNLIRNQAPCKGLRVRVPCPPLCKHGTQSGLDLSAVLSRLEPDSFFFLPDFLPRFCEDRETRPPGKYHHRDSAGYVWNIAADDRLVRRHDLSLEDSSYSMMSGTTHKTTLVEKHLRMSPSPGFPVAGDWANKDDPIDTP